MKHTGKIGHLSSVFIPRRYAVRIRPCPYVFGDFCITLIMLALLLLTPGAGKWTATVRLLGIVGDTQALTATIDDWNTITGDPVEAM